MQKIQKVVENRLAGLTVVLEDIHDPHNAAAIMRTCDALGVQDVHLVFEKEEKWNPRRIGKASSSSANKWLTFHTHKDTQACVDTLSGDGFVHVATSLEEKAVSLYDFDFDPAQKYVIWFGNEHRGLSPLALSKSTRLTIPMRGFVESFNVSVAAALFISHVAEIKRVSGARLSQSEREALFNLLKNR